MQEIRGSIPGRGTTDFCTLILFVYIYIYMYANSVCIYIYIYIYIYFYNKIVNNCMYDPMRQRNKDLLKARHFGAKCKIKSLLTLPTHVIYRFFLNCKN